MKISFMTFACPGWTFDQVVDAAVRHEYQGIEFRCDADHHHGVEVWSSAGERSRMRERLEREGLAACCLATSLQFVTDRVLEDAPARVQLAADLGCPALRVFCGPIPEGLEMSQAIDKVGRQLRQVAEIVENQNVELWLETHDSMSLAAHAAAAVQVARHPAVGINYDNMHPYRRGETVADTFAALGGLIRHCHFHDALNQPDKVVIQRAGQGELPLDEMFQGLVSAGFDGYLSGEWFNTQYGPDPDAALEAYRADMLALAERNGVRMRI
jgi:sugar phosphate isomerase/epimerase